MKIVNYEQPKSSFLSIDKDMNQITNRILDNDRLCKMLYYSSPDALRREPLTLEQKQSMFGKNIKIVPKLTVDNEVLQYLVIGFSNFITNPTNPQFRDHTIEFDIVCHFDQWTLGDFALRPYKIAAELDTMVNNRKFAGIGLLEFVGATPIMLTDEFGGLCLMYRTVNGEDDKKHAPVDQADIVKNFNKIFNEPKDESIIE